MENSECNFARKLQYHPESITFVDRNFLASQFSGKPYKLMGSYDADEILEIPRSWILHKPLETLWRWTRHLG